ncbi:hypothetical protein FOA52_011035 [Chlamydomonas sp. UWO 241]|nr:hypothetical protein FOA52_011035 [Chlamydomonas sp. UWO 241]
MTCYDWSCVRPANSLFYQFAQFFLLYPAFLRDTVFIRASVILGVMWMTLWGMVGNPRWFGFLNPANPGVPVDVLVWGVLNMAMNLIPLVKQLGERDARYTFERAAGGREWLPTAEAMWRAWFQRTGVSRADFTLILQSGTFVRAGAGEVLPSMSGDEVGDDMGIGNRYYMVLGGQVNCISLYRGLPVTWHVSPGSFANDFCMLTLFGSVPGALIMKDGPIHMVVADDSRYYELPVDNPSHARTSGGHGHQGALLFQFSRAALMKHVVFSGGFAAEAVQLMLGQGTIESLFKQTLKGGVAQQYAEVQAWRAEQDTQPLPPGIKELTSGRPFYRQWLRAHKLPWHVSAKERAVNALFVGSVELSRVENIRKGKILLRSSRSFTDLSDITLSPRAACPEPSYQHRAHAPACPTSDALTVATRGARGDVRARGARESKEYANHGYTEAYNNAMSISELYALERPPPIPQEEHVLRQRRREATEIVEAGVRKGLSEAAVREGLSRLEGLMPGLMSLHRLKASDWVTVLRDVDGVAAKVVALKTVFPTANAFHIVSSSPKMLLRTTEAITRDAQQVADQLRSLPDPGAIVGAVPQLLEPGALSRALGAIKAAMPTQDPLQVLQATPHVLHSLGGEGDVEDSAEYGEITTNL